MKQRTYRNQTSEQRIMRDMGALIRNHLPKGASLRFALKELWRKHPYGYKSFEAFYFAASHHPQKSDRGR